MTSGRSAAIFSNRMPSVFVSSSGGSPAAFAASCAHGPMPFSKPIQSVMPTGATPSAKNASCSLSPQGERAEQAPHDAVAFASAGTRTSSDSWMLSGDWKPMAFIALSGRSIAMKTSRFSSCTGSPA
jgi:hypothetical protein